jgi:hypothetical protein
VGFASGGRSADPGVLACRARRLSPCSREGADSSGAPNTRKGGTCSPRAGPLASSLAAARSRLRRDANLAEGAGNDAYIAYGVPRDCDPRRWAMSPSGLRSAPAGCRNDPPRNRRSRTDEAPQSVECLSERRVLHKVKAHQIGFSALEEYPGRLAADVQAHAPAMSRSGSQARTKDGCGGTMPRMARRPPANSRGGVRRERRSVVARCRQATPPRRERRVLAENWTGPPGPSTR